MATEAKPKPLRLSWMVGVCMFLLIAAFFLFTEHRAHIAGSLPYLLLLACPLIHLLMHRGHGHGGGRAHHGGGRAHDDQAHGGER